MPKLRAIRLLLITILLLCFDKGLNSAYAIDDGFGPAKETESKHFTIYYAPQLEVFSLAQALSISVSDKMLAGRSLERRDSSSTELADMVDILFTRVCNILDMDLYSFKGNIKICRDREQLKGIYNNLFEKELTRQSFYVYDLNTVYISADSFTREILGHEIAHAVISHYFVVLPSVKVQEILASYVEYQLRKTGE
jgi:hypothetical protein